MDSAKNNVFWQNANLEFCKKVKVHLLYIPGGSFAVFFNNKLNPDISNFIIMGYKSPPI